MEDQQNYFLVCQVRRVRTKYCLTIPITNKYERRVAMVLWLRLMIEAPFIQNRGGQPTARRPDPARRAFYFLQVNVCQKQTYIQNKRSLDKLRIKKTQLDLKLPTSELRGFYKHPTYPQEKMWICLLACLSFHYFLFYHKTSKIKWHRTY